MRPSLEERIEWFGNRLFPVFSGTVIGRLRHPPACEDQESAGAATWELPSQWPGLRLDPGTGQIEALGYGLLSLKGDELKVTPLFKISKDRLTLKATLFHQDFQGEAVQVTDIEQAVRELGVEVSLDTKAIKRHLKLARKHQFSQPDIPIGFGGTPPSDSRDASIELIGDSRCPVFSGDLIGWATKPARARSGKGIDGTVLEPARSEEPRDLQVPENAGWAFDPQTRAVTAEIYGLVVLKEDQIQVSPLLHVSEDRMQLTATLFHQDFLGQAVTVDRVRHELDLRGVKAKIELEALTQAIKKATKTREPQASILLARGTPPCKGAPGRLSLSDAPHDENQGEGAGASVDFREIRLYHSVQAGETVARMLGPGPGTPGRDIFGSFLQAEAGDPAQVRIGENLAVHQDGQPHTMLVLKGPVEEHRPADQGDIVSEPGLEFQSTAEGVVVWDGVTLSVAQFLEIKGDVDYSTGNICLESGSLVVRGTIRSGFTVQVPGNVLVDNAIEDARVTAGGDCLVKGGIVQDDSGLVRAAGNVRASFAENAVIEAGGDVTIDNDMTNCRVTAEGMVRLTAKKGILQGGTTRCTRGVEVNTIGSEHGIKTEIALSGGDRPDPELLKAKERIRAQIEKIDAALGTEDAHVILNRLNEPQRSKVARLITHKTNLFKRVKEIETLIRTKKEADLEASLSSRVTVLKTAHPGTEVCIGGRVLVLTDPIHRSHIFLDRTDMAVKAEPCSA